MRVYFSTVVRNAPPGYGGELVQVDWSTKTVVARTPIHPTEPDLESSNPRGGTRGGRGVRLLAGGEVGVCSYHTFKIFDADLRHRRDLRHRLMCDLHEICPSGERTMWFTSTSIDAAFEIDLETGEDLRQRWPRELPGLRRQLRLTPFHIDKAEDHRSRWKDRPITADSGHTHLNALAEWNGTVYALLNRSGTIVNLDDDEVVIRDRRLKGGHNLLIDESGIAMSNDTRGRSIRFYDLGKRKLVRVIDLTDFPFVRKILRRHGASYRAKWVLKRLGVERAKLFRPIFVRGLDHAGGQLFVGVSPATILCIDHESGRLVDLYQHSPDVRVCVHGLAVWNPAAPPTVGAIAP